MRRMAQPNVEVAAAGSKALKSYALKMGDASADKVIPDGQYAICERIPNNLIDVSRFKAGDLLEIERERAGLVETSIMQVTAVSGGQIQLTTPTRNPKLRREAVYPAPSDTGEVIRICGRVRGAYLEF
jgi:hypothetical protein